MRKQHLYIRYGSKVGTLKRHLVTFSKDSKEELVMLMSPPFLYNSVYHNIMKINVK